MLCVLTLNDAKNYAQQGCAMQFSGITLTTNISANESLWIVDAAAILADIKCKYMFFVLFSLSWRIF